MSMLKGIFSKGLVTIILLTSFGVAFAQSGAYTGYTPYSIYGIGELNNEGSAHNNAMGGVGIATRNRKYINTLNPASVTARDSLSFMADLGLLQTNLLLQQTGKMNVNNNVNIQNIAMSFPVYKSSAMMLGIAPFSSIGYKTMGLVEDESIISETGNIVDVWSGDGGLNRGFVAAGVTFWKKLSIGAEYDVFFGKLTKDYTRTLSNKNYSGYSGGNNLTLRGQTFKGGLQYEQNIGRYTLGFGATYRMQTKLRGYVETYADTLSVTDTLNLASGPRLGSELGVGISFKNGEIWSFEIDYTRSDWTNGKFDETRGLASSSLYGSSFTASVAQTVRAGFEITPNPNDIRYYMRKCTYRAGFYYKQAYYKYDGNTINTIGLTLGATFPIFRLSNGLTVGMEIGQRGSLQNNMVRERFINFSAGFNLYDIWFRKARYN